MLSQELLQKLLAVPIDEPALVRTEQLHLPQVRLGRDVALEPILVPALLRAHLAVEPEFLQALRLGSVRDALRGEEIVLAHPPCRGWAKGGTDPPSARRCGDADDQGTRYGHSTKNARVDYEKPRSILSLSGRGGESIP